MHVNLAVAESFYHFEIWETWAKECEVWAASPKFWIPNLNFFLGKIKSMIVYLFLWHKNYFINF
jgi:hypothetical protein